MSANLSAQAGQSQITLFDITSNYTNKNVLVAKGTLALDYYESILDHTVRATATLMDTGYREGEQGAVVESKDIKLNVGEFVNLKFVDGNGFELNFTGDKKLRILQTRDIQENVNKISYTIDMTSVEYDDNPKEKCAVNRRYDGKPDQTVRRVLSECLKTNKRIDVDSSLNNFNILGRNQTPFHICSFLASRSIPDVQNANQNLAGYFFFETADGYKFKSIDKLLSQNPKRRAIYNEVIESSPPPMYDYKILSYSFDKTLNLKRMMETGAFGQTKMRTFDTKPGNSYKESDFNYQRQFNQSNNAGTEAPKTGSDQNETTKRYYSVNDHGLIPSGNTQQQLDKKEELNYDPESIARQAIARYNSLFSIKVSMVIPGDFSLRAGDLIHCDFPEVSGNSLKTYSAKKSGIYMIADLCHHITKEGAFTGLNLVRDSIGRKPIKRN